MRLRRSHLRGEMDPKESKLGSGKRRSGKSARRNQILPVVKRIIPRPLSGSILQADARIAIGESNHNKCSSRRFVGRSLKPSEYEATLTASKTGRPAQPEELAPEYVPSHRMPIRSISPASWAKSWRGRRPGISSAVRLEQSQTGGDATWFTDFLAHPMIRSPATIAEVQRSMTINRPAESTSMA